MSALVVALFTLLGQITPERLVRAADQPQNWLTYSGTYSGQRYSTLTQIDRANVKNLEMKWLLQNQVAGPWESSPLVIDGIMYLTQRPNDVIALDARTGRIFWIYKYTGSAESKVCCGANNRGLAILGDTLFMGTLDAHLVALDAKSGRVLWNVAVAEFSHGYSITLAPLALKDKVIVGIGGGEYGIRGFIAAYDAATGKEAWRFYTIPAPGEPGSDTWTGDTWKNGGGSLWVTGTYDPALNLTYWGVGNPGPDFNAAQRPGDNLYTDSVVALDADTGRLRWHFQFTPNDRYDWDATQVPVLVDTNWNGTPAKLLMLANRNGFFYVLDRSSGKFLFGKPFVKVNWTSGLDANGRPMQTPQPPGGTTWPGQQGGRVGTHPRTVRARDSSTFQHGKTFPESSPASRLSTSRGRTTGEGTTAQPDRPPMHRSPRTSAAGRSTTGPTPRRTAPLLRSIRTPASANGPSGCTT